MSGIKLQYSVLDSKVQEYLELLIARARSLRPVMRSAGEYFLREIEERFDTEQDPQGMPWVELSEERRREKKNPRILTESTRLRNSMAYKASDDQVRVGTNVVYAAIHQLGGEIEQPARTSVMAFNSRGRLISRKQAGRKTEDIDGRRVKRTETRVRVATIGERTVRIPARPFLGVTGKDRRKIIEILREHLGLEQ